MESGILEQEKKPERIMALSFIMVLGLLIYRLAEFRLRCRLAQTQRTIPMWDDCALERLSLIELFRSDFG